MDYRITTREVLIVDRIYKWVKSLDEAKQLALSEAGCAPYFGKTVEVWKKEAEVISWDRIDSGKEGE
jgi:hypothetical protein